MIGGGKSIELLDRIDIAIEIMGIRPVNNGSRLNRGNLIFGIMVYGCQNFADRKISLLKFTERFIT